jgi:MFS family permease
MIYQGSEMVLAFFFALLVLSGKIQYWHILVFVPFFGFLKAVYVISRQAYVFDLVGKEDLMNALALHSSGMNLAKIIGPSIAGILIGIVGVGWCLFINGLSFIGILVSLLMMHPPAFFKRDLHYPSVLQDLRETFVYLIGDRTMLLLITTSFSFMLFGMHSQVVLPLFAKYVLKVGPSGFGFLMASMGAGAVIGGVIMAGLGDIKKKGRFFLLTILSYGMLLILFSASSWFFLSLFLILLAGMMDRFAYLTHGLAIVLVWVGAKMLLSDVWKIPIWLSLLVILLVLAGAIGLSFLRTREVPRAARPEAAG